MEAPAEASPPSRRQLLRLAQLSLLLLVVSLATMKPAIRIEGLRSTPTDMFFLLTSTAWAAALLTRQTRLRWHAGFWFIAVYLAAMLLSGLASAEPRTSAVKLVTQLYLLSLPVLAYNLIGDLEELKRTLRAWLYGTGAVSILCTATVLIWAVDPASPLLEGLRHNFGTLPPGNYLRVELSFQTPALLCNYLVASLAILLVCDRNGWISKPWFRLLMAGTCLGAILCLTPGLGGLPLLLCSWYWLCHRGSRPLRAMLALAAGIAASVVFILFAAIAPYIHPTAPFLIHLPFGGPTVAPGARLTFWIAAWESFLQHPLLGSGVGTDAIHVHYQYVGGHRDLLTDAHNVFLNIAATCGIVGLAAMSALLAYVWRSTLPLRLGNCPAQVLRLGLGLGYLNCFAYQGLTGSYEDTRYLWILLGFFLVSLRLEREGGGASGRSPSDTAGRLQPSV